MGRQNSTGATMVDMGYRDAKAVVRSDTIGPTTRLRDVRGIWSDAGGTISVITEAVAALSETQGGALTGANAIAFTLPAGKVLELQIAYVLLTGTAATDLKVLF